MLRNFYILICIPLCFCIEYFEDNHRNHKWRRNENGRKREQSKVVFDVASFIGNSVTDNSPDYEPYVYRNMKRENGHTQSEDYYDASINENIKKRDELADYSKVGDNGWQDFNEIGLSKQIDNTNSYDQNEELGARNEGKFILNKDKIEVTKPRQQLLIDNNDDLKNPEKKCAFKQMKVPFFSHKKSSNKRQKKKKSFCFYCAKSYTTNSPKCTKQDTKKTKSHDLIKRAYRNLCPKCINKMIKLQRKEPKIRQIFNSREFYQNIGQLTTQISNQQGNADLDVGSIEEVDGRYKRDDGLVTKEDGKVYIGNEETERQLKELAEVESKVQQVEIATLKQKNHQSASMARE